MEPNYQEFIFGEGTFEFKGRDAIIAALLRKRHRDLPIATFSRELMQETCRKLESTALPHLNPIPDETLWDGEEREYGRKRPDSHYRSKRAADQITREHPDFLTTVDRKWAEAENELSEVPKTLAGNRTEAYIT
jgi:hypothetical protein